MVPITAPHSPTVMSELLTPYRVLLMLLIVNEEPAEPGWITHHQHLHRDVINYQGNGLRLELLNEGHNSQTGDVWQVN